jgi:hypothetical protein
MPTFSIQMAGFLRKLAKITDKQRFLVKPVKNQACLSEWVKSEYRLSQNTDYSIARQSQSPSDRMTESRGSGG